MKYKDLKKFLDNLTIEQLNQDVVYNSDEYSISGIVNSIRKSPYNLYYTGEDDPSILYTRTELKENGFDNKEIENMDIEIKKGQIVLTF